MVTKHLKKLKHVRLHPHPTVNKLLFLIIFIAIAAALYIGAVKKELPKEGYTYVTITNSYGQKVSFYSEVADDDTERIQGLSDRDSLEQKNGMFFVFEKEDIAGFWMLKMKFPIDMVFFDKNMVIVDMQENVQPCVSSENCQIYYSRAPVMYVLEINAGAAKENNVRVGDKGEYS